MITVELDEAEAAALCFDLEHSPDCVWTHGHHLCVAFVDDDGVLWADALHTRPYEAPACTCGYFALLDRAKAKIRAARDRA